MKCIKFIGLCLCVSVVLVSAGFAESGTLPNTQQKSPDSEEGARGVIKRLLPMHAQHFVTENIAQEDGRDVFEIKNGPGSKITLRGSTGVAICSALNWYLKYECHSQFDWFNKTITNLPATLPRVSAPIRKRTAYKYRYNFNYCTFSYTMAFWDWERWQQEIDWMALNGINLPLAITGQEAVWRRVYREMGLSDKDVNAFCAGPAYFGWGWMGNLDGWGGPLPESWYQQQEALQKNILARQRSLGITPILPAFTGHVPAALEKIYPDATIRRMNGWGGFPGTYILDPMDPLFAEIGAAFIREQTKTYGTDHYYTADTFNEMDPPSGEPDYLREVSQAIYQSIAREDDQATIVIQGWMFMNHASFWKNDRIKAFLDGVADDRMIVLDLFATSRSQWGRTEAYFGKPWVWCMLHNWGGKMGTYGRTKQVAQDLPNLLGREDAGKLSGIGLTMEGLETNPFMYDLMTEMTWHTEPVNRSDWTKQYARRRYGKSLPAAEEAWQLLLDSVYDCRTKRRGPQGSHFCMRPTPHFSQGSFVRSRIFYDPKMVREALRLLLSCSDELNDNEKYRYDLVDIARQTLSDWSVRTHEEMGALYQAGKREAYRERSQEWLSCIRDMDRLLGTRREFLLGAWLEKAKALGNTDAEKKLYEWNARNLITLWGPPNSPLHDYAQKQWNGLIGDFYYVRWQLLFDSIQRAWENGEGPDLSAINSAIVKFESRWVHESKAYPIKSTGDPIKQAQHVYDTYR